MVLCTTAILLNLAQNMYGPFLSPYYESVGAPIEILGVIFSVMALANAAVMLVGGHVADLYGRKTITVLGSAIMAIFILPLFLIGLWYIAVICLIMVNFGMNIYRPGAYALIVESLPAEKRATGFSSIAFIAGLGSIFAPTIAGYLSLGGDYRLIFLLASVALFVMTIARQLFLTETKHEQGTTTKRNASKSKRSTSFLEKLKLTWHSSTSTRAYLLYSIASSLGGSIIGPYYALFYLNVIGLDQLGFGWLVSASLASSLISQIPGGKLSDRVGRKPLMLLNMIVGPFAIFAIMQTTDFFVLLTITIVTGIIGGLSSGAFYTLPAELVKKEYRGTALGMFNALGRIAGAVGPLLGSLIVANYPFDVYPRLVFYVSIVLSIPGIIIFAVFIKETLVKSTD